MARKIFLSYLYLIIAIFLWATIEIAMKSIQDNTSPILINFLRFFIGGISLLVYRISTRKSQSLIYLIKTFPKSYIIASFFGLTLGMTLFAYGTSMTESYLAAAIISSNPLMISTYMILFKGEKRSLNKIFGIILGFFGMIMIITEFKFKDFLQMENLLGNILVFIGTALWCIDLVIGKILLEKAKENEEIAKVTSLDFNIVTFLTSSIFMIPFLFFPGEFSTLLNHTWDTWLILLYLGIFATGISYFLFFKGISKMEASKGINIVYLKPIFATILSFIIFDTNPSIFFYIGCAIEILALIIISYEKIDGKS
ncbi:DMT family transporter [Promethearchaeum syntrophicum]|uniref:DMT family transporter n=1 Tax=Promethearchaeum syntrophicum TaxID=2594042 RepID=A0A5B9DAC9_9ARCH|nr:DMT family transporter [Candidatus Prometheoarchaeum syntrophicum]QEE15951.1 putative DMT superfamily transporter inner membrane protein [Candidatus Prometheoarchaeum syntrophicum]